MERAIGCGLTATAVTFVALPLTAIGGSVRPFLDAFSVAFAGQHLTDVGKPGTVVIVRLAVHATVQQPTGPCTAIIERVHLRPVGRNRVNGLVSRRVPVVGLHCCLTRTGRQ